MTSNNNQPPPSYPDQEYQNYDGYGYDGYDNQDFEMNTQVPPTSSSSSTNQPTTGTYLTSSSSTVQSQPPSSQNYSPPQPYYPSSSSGTTDTHLSSTTITTNYSSHPSATLPPPVTESLLIPPTSDGTINPSTVTTDDDINIYVEDMDDENDINGNIDPSTLNMSSAIRTARYARIRADRKTAAQRVQKYQQQHKKSIFEELNEPIPDVIALPPDDHLTIFDIPLSTYQSRPWDADTINIGEYFNYGFNASAWTKYAAQQRRIRDELTIIQETRKALSPSITITSNNAMDIMNNNGSSSTNGGVSGSVSTIPSTNPPSSSGTDQHPGNIHTTDTFASSSSLSASRNPPTVSSQISPYPDSPSSSITGPPPRGGGYPSSASSSHMNGPPPNFYNNGRPPPSSSSFGNMPPRGPPGMFPPPGYGGGPPGMFPPPFPPRGGTFPGDNYPSSSSQPFYPPPNERRDYDRNHTGRGGRR